MTEMGFRMTPIIAITAKTEELRNRPQTTIPNAYARVVEEAGGVPVIIPISDKKETITQIARFADGFLFSGGDDIHPRYYGEKSLADMVISPDERTEFETALLIEAMQLRKPVLGICLGAQLINVVLGGSLYQDIPSQIVNPLNHRDQHIIKIVEGTMLYKIFSNKTLTNCILTNDDEKIPLNPPLSKGEIGGFILDSNDEIYSVLCYMRMHTCVPDGC
jgi:putative glutamine amidotransferase